MKNILKKIMTMALVFTFMFTGLTVKAEGKAAIKPIKNPVVEAVTKLYAEREIVSSKVTTWELHRDTLRDFTELMTENPGTLKEEKGDFYIKLLGDLQNVFFEIDKALAFEKGSEDLYTLSTDLSFISAAIKALINGATMSDVEDIIADSTRKDPRFPALASVLKNQAANTTNVLGSRISRSNINRPQAYRAAQYSSPNKEYLAAIETETKLIEFANDQIQANSKLVNVLVKDLYAFEPGGEKEKVFVAMLSKVAELQKEYSLTFEYRARYISNSLRLILVQIISNSELDPLTVDADGDVKSGPYLKTVEARKNVFEHIRVYAELDTKFEEEHYRLLKLTSEVPEINTEVK